MAYVLLCVVLNLIGRAKLEQQLAEMKKEGIPSTMEEASPRQPKNKADNGIYYLKAAEDLLEYTDLDTVLNRHMMPGQTFGYRFNLQAWDSPERETVIKKLSSPEVDRIMLLFHQASQKPMIDYNRDYQEGIFTRLPELAPQRNLFRLLAIKSSLLGMEGKRAEAYSLIGDGLRIIKLQEGEIVLIGQLVNIADLQSSIEAMLGLLGNYGIDNPTARELLRNLDKFDAAKFCINGFNGEILIWRREIEWYLTGQKRRGNISQIIRDDFLKTWAESCVAKILTIIDQPVVYLNYNYYLGRMQALRQIFKRPYPEAKEMIINFEKEKSLFYSLNFGLEGLPGLRIKAANAESEIAVARLSLALHIYKNNHGAFPEKLAQLVPEILPQLPRDPVSGKEIEYRQEGNYFKLDCAWFKERDRKAAEQAAKNKKSSKK